VVEQAQSANDSAAVAAAIEVLATLLDEAKTDIARLLRAG